MKFSYFTAAVAFCAFLSGAARPLFSQETSTAHAVVTATSKKAEDATILPRQSITLVENRKPQDVTGWVPLRGPRNGTQPVTSCGLRFSSRVMLCRGRIVTSSAFFDVAVTMARPVEVSCDNKGRDAPDTEAEIATAAAR